MPCFKAEYGHNSHIAGADNMSNDLILVIAGHYCVSADYADLSNLADTEIHSLELGIEQYQQYKEQGLSVKLVIWVNDIGLEPQQRERLLQDYHLPSNYSELLTQAKIFDRDIIVRFESRARNRASKWIRKLKHDQTSVIYELSASNTHLIRCIDAEQCHTKEATKTVLCIDDKQGQPLVIKEGGAAKCCAILATFFNELEEKYQVIKMIGIFNFLYVKRIHAGQFVAQTLLDFDTPMEFLFCDETKLVKTEL